VRAALGIVHRYTGIYRCEEIMHRTALTRIAPEIFRKRLLVEGHFRVEVEAETVRGYFDSITAGLGLRTYGDPIIHRTSGQGKEVNEGFDGFVPLVDSGIYIAVWLQPRFLSTILYTCGEFDEDRAVGLVRDHFLLADHEAAIF
jgi:hypothetical protein